MIGGIGMLLLLTKISQGLTEYGLENIGKGVMEKMKEQGKSKYQIIEEIQKFPLISQDLKDKLIQFVQDNF